MRSVTCSREGCIGYLEAWSIQIVLRIIVIHNFGKLSRNMTKGGSACIPGGKTGVFPLRPLHPRKIMLRALMYMEAGLLKRVRTAGFGVSTRMEP